MGRVRVTITMSLDGFVAGPRQSAEEPLGVGGRGLHDWLLGTRTFRQIHGMEGGTTGVDDDIARESVEAAGASVIGRNMFGPVRGPWGDGGWRGWWGDDPPFHTPVFVLTHHPRPPLVMDGGTTFHFVTDGIEAALDRAREAAAGRDVAVGGGGETVRQYLRAGLVDLLEVHVVPLLLGDGVRLFEDGGGQDRFVVDRVVASEAVVHHRHRRTG